MEIYKSITQTINLNNTQIDLTTNIGVSYC